jgi:hypothetical protein
MTVPSRQHQQRIAVDIGGVDRGAFIDDVRHVAGITQLGRVNQIIVGGCAQQKWEGEHDGCGQQSFFHNF